MKIQKYQLFILSLIMFSGCINLREEYPEIIYYRLQQEPLQIKNLEKSSGALLLRYFTSPIDLETEHLIAVDSDNRLQKYYYHRWTTDCPSLITDYFIERYNKLDAFTDGTIKESSYIAPNYVLEGQILEFIAYNNKNIPDSNYVVVTIQANLMKKKDNSVDNKVILNRTYTERASRIGNKVETIAPAFSKAVAAIADRMLADISETINQ